MEDEMTLAPEATGAEAKTPSTGAESQPVAPAQPTIDVDAIREQIKRDLAEQFKGELDAARKSAQSLADRKRNEALRKAKLLEEMAPVLGMDAEKLTEAKRAVIEKAFYDDTPEPEEKPTQATPATPAAQSTGPQTSAAAMAGILEYIERNTDLTAEDPEAIQIASRFAKLQPKTPQEQQQMMKQFNAALAKAQVAQEARAQKSAAREAQAAAVQDTLARSGSATGGLGVQGTAAGRNAIQEINDPDELLKMALKRGQ